MLVSVPSRCVCNCAWKINLANSIFYRQSNEAALQAFHARASNVLTKHYQVWCVYSIFLNRFKNKILDTTWHATHRFHKILNLDTCCFLVPVCRFCSCLHSKVKSINAINFYECESTEQFHTISNRHNGHSNPSHHTHVCGKVLLPGTPSSSQAISYRLHWGWRWLDWDCWRVNKRVWLPHGQNLWGYRGLNGMANSVIPIIVWGAFPPHTHTQTSIDLGAR